MARAGSADWRKLKQAGDQAYNAGLYRKAAGFFRQARRAAEESRDELGRVKCLMWEGESLALAGEADAALPLLLEAAQTSSAEADPADVYNAMTRAIEISADRKPAAFVRRLLADGWRHLERLGKESWGHKLHLREGELAFARGDFESALRAQQRAWHIFPGTPAYPAYTAASHLACLCDCAFALHDREEMTRWVDAIEANRPETEEDRIGASLARLLLLRSAEDRDETRATAAEIARSVLRRLDASEDGDLGFRLEALRALAVFGSHTEVERRLESLKPREQDEIFAYRLLGGDFALCRARASLEMEPRDDEWDRDFPLPSPPFPGRDAALDQLTAAEAAFEGARPVAEREDQRLETTFYSRTLDGRLERVRALRRVIEAVASRLA